jgi:ribosomal protein S18 acetylase RimI-like enzyme
MTVAALAVRPAEPADLEALHPVIERAYRGKSGPRGWTHEADMLSDDRTDLPTLQRILATAGTKLLVGHDGTNIIGCVQVTDRGDGLCYLGLLCVDPLVQAGGLGRQLLDAADRAARDLFGGRTMEMTVLEARVELIAYYERRGYSVTGERRAFPIPLTPPLFMTVLAKPLR